MLVYFPCTLSNSFLALQAQGLLKTTSSSGQSKEARLARVSFRDWPLKTNMNLTLGESGISQDYVVHSRYEILRFRCS